MPTLLYKDVGLVKGERFVSTRRVGGAMQTIKLYNMRMVDELIFLDITATIEDRPPDFEFIDDLADECFMPLTVGGGVRSLEDVRQLLRVGADKIAINTAAVEHPSLISDVAQRFGSQCVVASIDVRQHSDGQYEVFTRCGSTPTGREPAHLAAELQALGAGEILLTSIDRDGTMLGYDTELLRRVGCAVSLPVIASGGAGTYAHMAQALSFGRASAVAAASMFLFTQQTPLEAKRFLREAGFRVRL